MNTNQQLDLFRTGQPDEEAIRLLREYEKNALSLDPRGYCVCTSEGKDSRVLGHLMRRAGVKHFYIHNITGIDPPELVYFQRKNFQEYADMGYETHDCIYTKSIWVLMLENKVPPLRTIRYCCRFLKERRTPEQGRAIISTGVRKAESVRRKKQRAELELEYTHLEPFTEDANRELVDVCYNNPDWEKGGLITINPLAEWPDHWIWDYSEEAHLEQCKLYAEGFDRLGCIGCPQGGECQVRRQFKRWPGFELLWRSAFAKMYDRRKELGMKMTFASGDEWFEWWLSGSSSGQPLDEDQIDMYYFGA